MTEQDFKLTLEAARVNAGLKQTTAAAKLGISPTTLRGYEKAVAPIPQYIFRAACELYGVPETMVVIPDVARKGR